MKQKKKGRSVQNLIGISSFTDYGIAVGKYEVIFFSVSPVNISVLSRTSVETKIHHLLMTLSTIPELEMVCMDSNERFDQNQESIKGRLEQEKNPFVVQALQKDMEYLDQIQVEMANARQFFFALKLQNRKEDQVFQESNRAQKVMEEQGFDVKRMDKEGIKQMFAIYFGTAITGEQMPDVDGVQHFEMEQ